MIGIETTGRLDPGLLDRLAVPSTRYYDAELERIQLAQLGHGETTYLLARDGQGRPAGLTPVYTTRPPWHPAVDPGAIFEPPIAAPGPAMCLAGSHGVYANFLTVGASVPRPEAGPVATALVEQARAIARAAGCEHVLLPYLDETQAGWLAGYTESAVAVSEKAVLPVSWDSFEDYVSWLPGRRRTPVRRERRRFAESGIEVREQRMADVAGVLAPLLAQTEKRYGRDADPRQIEFHYTLLGMALGDDFIALVGYEQGRPVACSLLLKCGNRWISKAWGCDYAVAGDQFLYFNLLFYEPVVRAAGRGIEAIDYGLGGLESKTQRGCAVERLRTLLIDAGDG